MKYELKHYVEDRAFVDQMFAMMFEHAKERYGTANYNPDVKKILGLWSLGVLRVVTMRTDAGKLVGYQGWLCSAQLTNPKIQQAILTYVYVNPEFRGSGAQFTEFVSYGVQVMKVLGDQEIQVNIDSDQLWLRTKFEAAGFKTARSVQLAYTTE